MLRPKIATITRWGLLASIAVACAPSDAASHESTAARPAPITQAEAKRLLLNRYRALFKDMYLRDPRNGQFIESPPLDEAVFTSVEASGDAWIVQADPNAGHIIRGRVAKSGDWVELTEVRYTDW